MLILQISDLHLSRYGEPTTWTQRDEDDGERWEDIHSWSGWHIEGCRDRKGRPDDLRLVDPQGLVHKIRSWPSRKADKAISALLSLAMDRQRTSAEELVKHRPTTEDLEALLRVDPTNNNLRFLRLVDDIHALDPEVLLLTGDITNDGFGYELVRHYLAPWISKESFYAVPGNHDTYDMFPRIGRYQRTAAKEQSYADFASACDLEPGEAGTYLRLFGDTAVVGINSCMMPRTPLSASGAVSKEQLAWLAELGNDPVFTGCRLRIGLMHHHLLRMPYTVGKRNPLEAGMRLRNAVDTMEVLTEARMDIIFNGHRHHGYVVKLPGRPMVISGPSSTMGCKAMGRCYAWRLDLEDEQPFPRMYELSLTNLDKE